MAIYAKDTTVPRERSRAEIERTLARYGASRFLYGWEPGKAVIAFEAHGRRIRFELPMPERQDRAFTHTPTRGTPRSLAQQEAAYEHAVHQRWRALALVIKAKLEAVASGITCFEDEFLAHILLPNGQTVGRWLTPQLDQAYGSGQMPPLLLGPPAE
jgi:hypothetical protein